MTEAIKAYPLQWPAGWKRTEPTRRRSGNFSKGERRYSDTGGGSWVKYRDLSIADATGRVLAELRRMRIMDANIVISSNLKTGLSGLPLSKQAMPADPGIAVYWQDNTADGWPRRCMAVDQYDKVEHNLAAIAATLDAMRAIERHGGAAILNRAFTGFTALPAPMTGQKPWREVLGVHPREVDVQRIEELYRIRRGAAHPDKGGTQETFLAVQAAYEQAARELGFET